MWKIVSEYWKNLFVRKHPEVVQTISWNDILKPRRKKYSRSMLMPSNRVTIWKSVEKRQKGPAVECLNVMFKFNHEDEDFLIKAQRKIEEKIKSEALPKISFSMKKKINGILAHTAESICIKISPESAEFITENSTMEDFLGDSRIQSVLVNNESFRVVRNGIFVKSIQLAHTPLVGFQSVPTVFTTSFDLPISKNDLKYHWYVKNHVESEEIAEPTKNTKTPLKKPKIVKKAEEILKISFKCEDERQFLVENYTFQGNGPYFQPKVQDLHRKLAVLVESHPDHPIYGAIGTKPITAGPEELITDEQLEWCRQNKLDDSSEVHRVMCYNILADLYLNLNLEQSDLFFKYCEKDYQRAAYRTPLLLKQISDFAECGVSLFFLQEVDVSRNENYIASLCDSLGFQSVLAKKLLTVDEGVAVVFDQKRYRLISSESFPLAQLAEEEEGNEDVRRILESSELSRERFMSRPTVLQIVLLEDVRTKSVLICANTHLHHNPKEEQLKVLQSLVCVRKIMEFFEREKGEKRVIFGGDFNSTPDSPVFELLSTGKLSSSDKVWKLDEALKPEDLSLRIPLKCLSGTPEYTNYTVDSQKVGFVGCLDYLWGIGPTEIRQAPMPSHSKVVKFTAIPSPISPSDHLPIITDITL